MQTAMMPFERYPLAADEYQAAMLYFDEKFGQDPFSRLRKLHEECGELLEAIDSVLERFEKQTLTEADADHLTDEMSDVSAVMSHYLWVAGDIHDIRHMVKFAAIKVWRRETDPNYKR